MYIQKIVFFDDQFYSIYKILHQEYLSRLYHEEKKIYSKNLLGIDAWVLKD